MRRLLTTKDTKNTVLQHMALCFLSLSSSVLSVCGHDLLAWKLTDLFSHRWVQKPTGETCLRSYSFCTARRNHQRIWITGLVDIIKIITRFTRRWVSLKLLSSRITSSCCHGSQIVRSVVMSTITGARCKTHSCVPGMIRNFDPSSPRLWQFAF